MIKKQLLILLILLSSLAGYSQTITPQFKPVSGGLMSYFYTGKSPIGYDTIWNAQTIRNWVVNQPHIWYGNQTISGANLYITGNNKGVFLDNGSIVSSLAQMTINTTNRNGFQIVGANGQQIARFANNSTGADEPFSTINSNLSLKSMVDLSPYTGNYDILARVNSGAGTDEGFVGKIPANTFPTTANTYSKTQVDSVGNLKLNKTDTPAFARKSGNSTITNNNYVSRINTNTPTIGKNKTSIAAWGDSFTQNSGGWVPYLGYVSGYSMYNGGVGGESSSQILTRFLANPSLWGYNSILEMGRNNYQNGTQVLADIKRATDTLDVRNTPYLVISIFADSTQKAGTPQRITIDSINTALSVRYGAKYVNMMAYIISQYNPALPQDVIDHNNNITPTSLRNDPLHLNSAGYAKWGAYLYSNYLSSFQANQSNLTYADIPMILGNAPAIGSIARNIAAVSKLSIASTNSYPLPVAALNVASNISEALQGGLGSVLAIKPVTVQDTSSASGSTNSLNLVNVIAVPTLTATRPTTYTVATNLSIEGAPTAGTNVTITNPFPLQVRSGISYFRDGFNINTISPKVALINIGAVRTQNNNGTNGAILSIPAATITDNSTATSGTVAQVVEHSFGIPTFAATNTGITYTNASTVFISGAPLAGAGVTIPNAWAFYVNSGNSRFGGNVQINGLSTSAPVFTDASRNLTSTGVVPVANGGTGRSTVTIGAIQKGGATTTSPFVDAVSGTDYTTPLGTEVLNNKTLRSLNTYQGSAGSTGDSLRFASSQKMVEKAIVAGAGISVSQTSSTVTFSSTNTAVTSEITTNTAGSVQNRYITNSTSRVVVTLPTTANQGDVIFIVGKGSGGWQIAQNSGQVIHGNASDTTIGTTGYLQSQSRYNCVEIRCISTNTDWSIVNSNGALTTN